MTADRVDERRAGGVGRRAVLGGGLAAVGTLVAGCTDRLRPPGPTGAAPRASAPSAGPATTPPPGAAPLVGDGVTDNGPLLQQLVDAGGHVRFPGPGTYLVDTPVFVDGGDPHGRVVLDLAGGTLLAGPHLPGTDAFHRDPQVRWVLWSNTRRTAWDPASGRVTVSEETRATGARVGALQAVAVRDGTFDGVDGTVGLVFANRSGTELTALTMVRARTLVSWHDYSDATRLQGCHARHGDGPRTGALVEQVSPGDGLVLSGCKADSGLHTARLSRCRGAVVEANVTGLLELDSCSNVVVLAGHQEGQLGDRTSAVVRQSQVTFRQTAFYSAHDADVPSIVVDDPPDGPAGSRVHLDACVEVHLHDGRDADVPHGPLLHVAGANPMTEIHARDVRAVTVDTADPGVWVPTAGPRMTARGEVADAVADLAGVVPPSFAVSRRSGGWHLQPTAGEEGGGDPPAAPDLQHAGAADGAAGRGSLRRGATYTYWVAVRDTAGVVSAPARRTARASASGAVRLVLGVARAPVEVLLWRGPAGARAVPEHHVRLTCASPLARLLDTGRHVEGLAWQRGAGDPAPPLPP
ncbi:hypothetical protein [Cellulomonas telluris]|uniref:hypothetical protein n=1 Tax=Cellulomonas telluris TaxID=2306636 RepID=UPI0010A8347B|nr:hypothetical protein [Cellulomonas telluris]